MADEVWANVRDGGCAHSVVAEQLMTGQAALCGYQPPDGMVWWWCGGPRPRPYSKKCPRCRRSRRGGGAK